MPRRVVITGIGPVTSVGVGREAFWSTLCQPVAPLQRPVSFAHPFVSRSRWYVPLPRFDLADYAVSVPGEGLMQSVDRMAVLATRLALEDAGLEPNQPGKSEGLVEAAVCIGTGLGEVRTALESYLAHVVPREILAGLGAEKPPVFNRMVVPRTMPNSSAAWVSICFGCKGPARTLSASCASGTYAVGDAFRTIRDGYAEVALAGGAESLQESCGFMMRGFDVLGVLTTSSDGYPGPFGQRRTGFLFAEGGACMLVLEELERALSRKARIYAEISDFRANSEAYNLVQMDASGQQVTRLLRELSSARRVDYLNAHGTGTVLNEQVEARAIQETFGGAADQPLINSTKGILGHTLGASGAIEAAVAALSLAFGKVHANATREPMDDLNLPFETTTAPLQNALSVSYGFGGHNAGLAFNRFTR
jgi:3-oxoacyl-[acyl-carrier-protein] synthase II